MNVKQAFFRGLSLGLLLLLGACSAVPLRSLWSLRQFELSQLDVAQLRLPVYLPAHLGAAAEAVKLTVRAERGNAAREVLEETLTLRPLPAGAGPAGLQPPRPGGHWLVLALDAAEQQRLNQLRLRMLAWKAADGSHGQRRMGLEAQPQLCARPAAAPVDPAELRISAWLRWQVLQAGIVEQQQIGLAGLPAQPGADA
jgi:hypothetical protein